MDSTLYTKVLEFKHGRKQSLQRYGFTEDGRPLGGLTEAELCMRCDMAANKAAWTGSIASDLWLWTKNTNPLVALCFSHPNHPIGRGERYFILFLQVLLFAYIAMLLVRIDDCEAYHESHPSCGEASFDLVAGTLQRANPLATYSNETISEVCCTLSMGTLVRTYDAFDPARHRWWAGALADGLPVVGLTIIVTLLNIILGQIWFLLAGCPCCQKSAHRSTWEWVGDTILTFFALGPLAYIVWLVQYFMDDIAGTLVRFVVVKLASVFGSTVVQTSIFLGLWRGDMRGKREFYVQMKDVWAYEERELPVTPNSASMCSCMAPGRKALLLL